MAKFSFRLQKVLEYREMEEGWAKDAFVAAQQARTEKQSEIMRLIAQRSAVVMLPADSLDARIHLERVMSVLDDEERAHRAALAILENEEIGAQAEWNVRRQAVQALVRLRDKALDEWTLDEERTEQAALDEWVTTRRAA